MSVAAGRVDTMNGRGAQPLTVSHPFTVSITPTDLIKGLVR